nr:PEP-CTERM sorting domain-containing protein [Parazoarcus communis]
MLTGTFFFSTFVTNERYQLDIVVAPNGVVPEPGILAMLMIGFGLLGAMRQRSFIVAA